MTLSKKKHYYLYFHFSLAAKPTRARRGSVTSDTSETEPPKSVKTRRASVSKSEDSEEQVKPKPRGRRGSNASELEVELPKTPARATRRRGSATEEVVTEVLTPAKRGARGRKVSEDEDVKKPATRGRRRSVTVDEEEEAKEEAATKPKRGRRSSVDQAEAPKTPARVTRSNSTGTNESKPEDVDSEVKEVTVKLTPLKKKRLVEKVEAELDLSIINESVGDLNVSDPGTPKASPIKQVAELSPRKSPRLTASKSSPVSEKIANDTNTSKDSSFSNKENVDVEVNTQGAGDKKPSAISRVSNVFKPNQKECSFVEEPMDVDMSVSVIAPDNSVMENMPPATDSVILSGNVPTTTTKNITIEKSEQDSLSLLNKTVTSSTQMSEETNDANDVLLIEETENTVNISFKKVSESPDHSLVVNNTVEQEVKVVLSGKASSPIIDSSHRKLLRKSRSPNRKSLPNSDHQTLTVSRDPRRSKSKSKTPSPSVKDRVADDDLKASQSPKKALPINEITTQNDNNTEVLQEPTQVETPIKNDESIKNKSTEGHFADKDNDYEEILILNDGISPTESPDLSPDLSNTEDQTKKLKMSESTHYDFDLSSDLDETNAEDENTTVAKPGPDSVCSQDTVEFNMKSKDNSDATELQIDPISQRNDVDKKTENNDTTENLNESTVLIERSTPLKTTMESDKADESVNKSVAEIKCLEPESESAVEVMETEETVENIILNDCSKAQPESTVASMETEEVVENVNKNITEDECSKPEPESENTAKNEQSKEESVSEVDVMESEESPENVGNIVDDECNAKPESVVENEESVTTPSVQKDTTKLPAKAHEIEQKDQKKQTPSKKSPSRKLKLDDFASTKLSEYLKSKYESLEESSESEEEDSKSQEDYNEFIDGMAEEGEEDTPSEDSNQIIDEGESIGSSDSDQNLFEDDSYDPDDSFICDEEPAELLSGDEYDLDIEKKTKKGSRIIDPETLDVNNGIVTVPKKNTSPKAKPKRCRIITIENSSSEDEQENKEVTVLSDANVSRGLQNEKTSDSVIVIDDSEDPVSVTKNTSLKTEIKQNVSLVEEPPTTRKSLKPEESKETWQNVSLLQNISLNALTASAQKHNRKTSLTLQENIQVDNLRDPVVSQRINSLVQSFCSTIKKGEISLNLSLEYEDSQEPSPKESEEKTEAVHILSDVTLVTEETAQEVKNPTVSVVSDTLEDESNIMNTEENNEVEVDNVNLEVEDEVFETETVPNATDINNTSEEEVRTKRKKLKRRLSKSLSEIETETKKSKRRKKNRKHRGDSSDVNDLKTGTLNLLEQLVTDVKNRPKRIIKPSSPIPEGTWNISPVSSVKPSTCSATRPKPHPKDFKNQLLNDPSRAKRIETKKLLKKKGIY